jgi:hypothetical protein
LDGGLNTHWTTGAEAVAGIWFEVDMVTPRVFFYGRADRDVGVLRLRQDLPAVELPLDGNTFTQLRTNIVVEITFTDPQYWRYLKIETLDSTGFNWWRIDELAVLE